MSSVDDRSLVDWVGKIERERMNLAIESSRPMGVKFEERFAQLGKERMNLAIETSRPMNIKLIPQDPLQSLTGYEHAGARNFNDVISRPDPCLRDSFKYQAIPGDALLDDLGCGPFHSGM
jgi:hypothetical protein